MTFVELIVNVPIRRSFRQDQPPPPPEPTTWSDEPEDAPPAPPAKLQTFHYHLPPELENQVQPGHLVWVPFGRQEVQGVVLRCTSSDARYSAISSA
jgi:3'DNA-binding domain (3'BD)